MKVIPCGTIVRLKFFNIEAIISAISIQYKEVKYEVSYINNQAITKAWFYETDFVDKHEKINIGFKN